MNLDRAEVEKIATLARLAIKEENIAEYTENLSNILDLVDQMQAEDTENVEPLAHPLEAVQRLRLDEVSEPDQREHFQSIAPETEAGLYLVPKVIE